MGSDGRFLWRGAQHQREPELLDGLTERAGIGCEDRDLVTPVPHRGRELDRVELAPTHRHQVRIDDDAHRRTVDQAEPAAARTAASDPLMLGFGHLVEERAR